MFSSVLSAAVCGIESCQVHVEADVSDGLPEFTMVGYLTSQVKEASERVRTALKNSGISLQPKRITINLSPADLRKDGSGFDLPIAASVLAAYGFVPSDALADVLIVGELSLNGAVKGIHGILPMVSEAARAGCRACIIPKENEREGSVVEGISVIAVSNLEELMEWAAGGLGPKETDCKYEFSEEKSVEKEDFRDISGQEGVKRAAEVAAAGMHNLLLIGPPGSGKSMISARIAGILPKLSMEESLEISKIYSVSGLLDEEEPLITRRPFRSPHHTISPQALAGGGRIPRPGEVSLAHRGVLFLDELPEYSRSALEILRQPMEERQVSIARIYGNYRYPANFMLVAAMNPCKCGYYPDMNRCTCTQKDIHYYLNKLSNPLLDRIDITLEAPEIKYEDLVSRKENESSAKIRERVVKAQDMQKIRYRGTSYRFNSDLDIEGMRRFCPLGREEELLLKEAFQKLELSARAYHRIIKVSRTIADLAGEEVIKTSHVAEAVCYRSLERRYWI